MSVNGSGQNEQSLDPSVFLAHLAKGKVSFCHHLASVICRPLTFHMFDFSSETPHQVSVHLVKRFQRRLSLKIACGGHVC
jgi:hypothetical protein